ncbi:MAG: ATP-binding protein [Anaerolineae bacterium]
MFNISIELVLVVAVVAGLLYWGVRYGRGIGSKSLNTQLILAFAAVVLITVVLVVGIIIAQIRLTLAGQVGRSLLELAQSETQRMGEQLTVEIGLLQTLSKDAALYNLAANTANTSGLGLLEPEERLARLQTRNQTWADNSDPTLRATILDVNINRASRKLNRFVGDFPGYAQVALVGQYGELLAAGGAAPEGYYFGDQPWWPDMWQGRAKSVFIGNPQVTPGGAHTTIDIAIPLYSAGEQVQAGVIFARFKIDNLRIFADFAATGQVDRLYLVNSEGLILHSSEADQTGGRIPQEVQDSISAFPFQWGIDPDQTGQNIIHSHATLLGTEDQPSLETLSWTIIMEQTQANALQVVNRLTQTAILGGLLVIALALFMARWTAQRVTEPIETLTQIATGMAESRLTWQAPVVGPVEFRMLAQAFNTMTGRLRDLIDTLESRIKERTQSLETSSEIGRQITAMLNLDELLRYVVNRIQTEFKYYHTHIYLVEEETGDLVMAEGSGDAGRLLKEKGHRLRAGEGIVGTVESTGESFVSNNVGEVINFVPNPLLPYTKSEMAVPLRKGNQVLGVLDIQSEELNRFKGADISLMQSLGNQLAVAIDNARLLAQTQTALNEVGRLNRRLTREVWEEFGAGVTTSGYRFKGGAKTKLEPDSEAWLLPMKEAAEQKRLVEEVVADNGRQNGREVAVPLVLRGEVIGMLGVKRDSPQKWAEEELAVVEAVAGQTALALENARLSKEQDRTIVQLKEVDRLKSDFLTSMSHELRTPLNSIIGFADILLQGIDGPLEDNAITDIRAIHNSGKHLLALINDILDLSKIEAGRMELACSPLTIERVFSDVAASVSSLLTNRDIELRQEIEPDLPPIWADSLRLNQVIINLVSNAIKFTEEGAVTMGAATFNPKLMRIYIQDTGIGIPEDKFGLVFEHFRQVDSRNSRKYQGTGMGLAIARQLVALHGGEMWLESAVDQGSTFHFTIPFMQEVAP